MKRLQQQIGDAVYQPGDAEVEPCEVSVDFRREQRSQEYEEQANAPASLEGNEDPQLSEVGGGLQT